MSKRIKDIVLVAIFVAVTSVCAIVTIPFGPVPFTLQTLAFTLILFCLSPSLAFASVLLYVALGGLGAPIFSGMKGGIGSLIGPTGGFLIGYVLAIYPCGKLLEMVSEIISNKVFLNFASLFLGVAMTCVAYVFGCFQYAFVAGVSIQTAFFVCVLPFFVIDAIKICVALALSQLIKNHLA